ncbi:MAG TPA: hypothetical protein VFU43_01775 [Streptosporangiaceae bacterium]|nr:hypothetical protein [Streptosporangiaceae bacterium]
MRIFLAVAAGLVLAVGCSPGTTSPKSIAVTHYRGLPPGVAPAQLSTGVNAVWRAGRLEITTWGSGSCPGVPTGLRARGAHALEVTISDDYSGACTADLAPTTSVIEVPDGIASAGPLAVTVRGKGRSPINITVPRP